MDFSGSSCGFLLPEGLPSLLCNEVLRFRRWPSVHERASCLGRFPSEPAELGVGWKISRKLLK